MHENRVKKYAWAVGVIWNALYQSIIIMSLMFFLLDSFLLVTYISFTNDQKVYSFFHIFIRLYFLQYAIRRLYTTNLWKFSTFLRIIYTLHTHYMLYVG